MSKRSSIVSTALAALAFVIVLALPGVAAAQNNVIVQSTIGAGLFQFPTFKAAIDSINNGTYQGAITVSVRANVMETVPSVLNASGVGAASYTSILIRPFFNGPWTVGTAAGFPAGSPLLDLNGASNVTIDGAHSSGPLTFGNGTVSAAAGTSTIRLRNGASNNTITNAILRSSFTGAVTVEGGTVVFGTDTVTANGNDNNTISNNLFQPGFSALPADQPT